MLTTASVNVVLILVGVHFAPATLGSPTGVEALVADIGMQVFVVLALWGTARVAGLEPVIGICVGFGAAFAATYLALLLADFGGHPLPLSPFPLFIAAAGTAGFAVAFRSGFIRGVAAGVWTLLFGTAVWSAGMMLLSYAFWGTESAYMFWLRDGAVEAFHRSHEADFATFLLQDIEGALFFHPILSAVVGVLAGSAGAGLGHIAAASRRLRPRKRSAG